MIKESNLSTSATISNDDFIRFVTEAGLSKKVLCSVLKAFIGADTITKVSDYYYFQDASIPEENDYRIYSNGIYLDFERYDGTDWDEQFRIGGSAFVSNFLELYKNPTADILVNDGNSIRNLIRNNTWSDGTFIADVGGDTILATEDKLYKASLYGAVDWVVIQSDYTQTQTGTSFYLDYTISSSPDVFQVKQSKIKLAESTALETAQIKVFKSTDLVNPIWQNMSDEGLEADEMTNFDNSTGIITFEPAFYGIADESIRIQINFKESVSVFGDGSDIYFESYQTPLKLTEFGVYGSECEVFTDESETTAGSSWTNKINVTTELKPSGQYEISYSCEITETDNSQEVRFLLDGAAIHNHTTGNDELEPYVNEDNWVTLSNVKYVTITTTRTLALAIQHKDSGTGKMSNASIKIIRIN